MPNGISAKSHREYLSSLSKSNGAAENSAFWNNLLFLYLELQTFYKCSVLRFLYSFSHHPKLYFQEIKLVKSPWEAAMQNPYGFCDSAFARVNPDQLADTVIKRADFKRSESLSRESSRMEGCISPPAVPPLTPAGAMYDIYHAKAPKGWLGGSGTSIHLIYYFIIFFRL